MGKLLRIMYASPISYLSPRPFHLGAYPPYELRTPACWPQCLVKSGQCCFANLKYAFVVSLQPFIGRDTMKKQFQENSKTLLLRFYFSPFAAKYPNPLELVLLGW